MEFFCVLSVDGSLASYHVRQESQERYIAELRSNNGKRDDVPAEISFVKDSNGWQAEPWHEDVVKGLIQAIESSSR